MGNAKFSGRLAVPMNEGTAAERVIFSARKRRCAMQRLRAPCRVSTSRMAWWGSRFEKGALEAKGPVKINGVPVEMTWRRAAGPGGKQSALIEATLDDEERKKIGVDLGEFLRGPMAVKADLADLADPEGRIDIEADLSKSEMQIAAISGRGRRFQDQCELRLLQQGEKGRRIEDLVIKGEGLLIRGDVSLLPKGGMKEARLSEVRLSDENRFALTMSNGENGSTITINGDSFDARPLIRSMFGATRSGGSDDNLSKRTLSALRSSLIASMRIAGRSLQVSRAISVRVAVPLRRRK